MYICTYTYTLYIIILCFLKQITSQFTDPSVISSRCLKDRPMSVNNMDVNHSFKLSSNPEFRYTSLFIYSSIDII